MNQQLAAGWDVSDPAGRDPVHRLVAGWAAATPDALAVTCAGRTLSYRELDERANRLGNHLRALGAGRDVVVALHLDRGLDYYVALLAVLKSGSAALPLDPTYPRSRLGYMLGDSGARVLVTRTDLPPVGDGDFAVAVVDVDADADAIAANPATPPPDDVQPGDLAYVMYTSASTGPPKGVQLEHGGIANLCRWHVASLGLTAADRGSLAAPLSFDASIVDLWPLLTIGARTVVVPDDARADLAELTRLLRESGVTVCFLTTALAELFLAQPGLEDLPLRHLVTGGEALRRRPRPGLPFRLVNVYGPTETTVYATSTVVADSAAGSGPIPIGSPVGGAEIRLLAEDGTPVPHGEPGEVVVAGAGVGRGYLGKPELTARRFRTDADGTRCYHTGDLARWRPDGMLEFLGRIDRQLKVRGHRIEPEEQERVLLDHPAVRQAAVAAVHPTPDTVQLVAYVEADPKWTPDEAAAPVPPAPPPAPDPELDAVVRALGRGGAADVTVVDLAALGQASAEDVRAAVANAVANAVDRTPDGGVVVVGGVPSLSLLPAAHLGAELAEATDDQSIAELRWRVRAAVRAEQGLAVHPAVFTTMPGRVDRLAAAEVWPRCHPADPVRYDAVLWVGTAPAACDPHWLDWHGDGLDLAAVRSVLRAGTHEVLGVRGVPHGGITPLATAWQDPDATGDLAALLRAVAPGDLPAPIDLRALATGLPYGLRLRWTPGRDDGTVDAVWFRTGDTGQRAVRLPTAEVAEPAVAVGPPARAASDAALTRALRAALSARFVAHELPDLVVVLDRMPLTPVGKVDRNALPMPHWLSASGSGEPPRTDVEAAVAELTAEVLGRRRVGRTDDLRALGAHSLTMTQVAARLRSRYDVTLPIRALLAEPTVAAVAARVTALLDAAEPAREAA